MATAVPTAPQNGYSVIGGVALVYPTLFDSGEGSVSVTVVDPARTIGPDTTAQFDACSPGLSTGKPSASVGSSWSGGVGVFTVPAPGFSAKVTSGTCGLYLSGKNGSGFVNGPDASGKYVLDSKGDTAPYWLFSFEPDAPSLTGVTPNVVPQGNPNEIRVMVQGQNLSPATTPVWFNSGVGATAAPMGVAPKSSVFTVNCRGNGASPASTWTPAPSKVDYASTSQGAISTLVDNGTVGTSPQGDATCDIVVPVSGGANANGYEFLALSQKLTYRKPYQGPIAVNVTNDTASSGVASADLHLGRLGTGTGTWSGPWVDHGDGWSTVPFPSVATSDKNTAQVTFTPPWTSGDLYFIECVGTSAACPPTSPPSPTDPAYRYGFVEMTYTSSNVNIDVTLVDQIGFPLVSTMAYKGAYVSDSYMDTGCFVDVALAVRKVAASPTLVTKVVPGGAPDEPARWTGIISPGKLADPVSAYGSMAPYAAWVAANATDGLHINDLLGNSGAAIDGIFDYTARFVPNTTEVNGVVLSKQPADYWILAGTYNGTDTRGSGEPGPMIVVEASSLSSAGTHGGTGFAIYGQNGPFKAFEFVKRGVYADPYGDPDQGWDDSGGSKWSAPWQNMLKTVYRDFITPFANGLWGADNLIGDGTPLWTTGPQGSAMQVDPRSRYYGGAWRNGTGPVSGSPAWNVYQEVIANKTNIDFLKNPTYPNTKAFAPVIYGMPYGDTLMPQSLSPDFATPLADTWNITLGNPASCSPAPPPVQASVTPAYQSVKVDVGTPIATAELAPAGFPGPVTYSIKPALPESLALNPASGQVTGTPTAVQSKTMYTITGRSGTTTGVAHVSIAVGEDPSPPDPTPTPAPLICPPPGIIVDGMCAEPA